TCSTQQTGANCGARTSAARLVAASLRIRSTGHKRSPLQKVSQKFCGRPKSQPPRSRYLDWSNASLRASGSAEREVWTGRTGRRRTTEENDKKRRFEIVILVLVALGALAAGAGIALYFAYPIRVETAAGEVRAYILSLTAPPGTVTTEENAAYKRGGAAPPQAAAAAVPGAAAGHWPSYNKTLTSERFSDLSQINIANVAKLKVQCTYDTHQYSAPETSTERI